MHKQDVFVTELCEKFKKGKARRKDQRHSRIADRVRAKSISAREKAKLRKELRKLPSKDQMDPNIRRMHYVRYADDFIISIIGSYEEATAITKQIEEFLSQSLSLKLNQSKTKITHARKGKAKFLSTRICWKANYENKKVVLKKGYIGTHGKKVASFKARITPRIVLECPINELRAKQVVRKMKKWQKSGSMVWPSGLKCLQNLDHADIVGYYNAVLRGIIDYYSFRANRSHLGGICNII